MIHATRDARTNRRADASERSAQLAGAAEGEGLGRWRFGMASVLLVVAVLCSIALMVAVQPASAQSSGGPDRVAARTADTNPVIEVVPAGEEIDEDEDQRGRVPATGGPAKVGPVVASTGWRCPVPGGKFFNDWGQARSGGRSHTGTDMLAPRGTPIYAPIAGTVSFSMSRLGGKSFYLKAPNGLTLFGTHLDAYGVAGKVEPGAIIGYVGDTGNARGTTHLHFEIHPSKNAKTNPYPVLKQIC
jgi:peptidoglycan LD-endopeptidase LytH